MEVLKNIVRNRIVIFGSFLVVFVAVNFLITGSILPSTDTKDIWFYSGLFMLVFSTLFIEPYYSSPKNVITNVVPLFLVFIAIEQDFSDKPQWLLIMGILGGLLVLSVLAMMTEDPNDNPSSIRNRASERLKNISIFFGRAKVLYSAVFLYFLFTYYVDQKELSGYVFVMFLIWAFTLLINPNDLTNALFGSKKEKDRSAVGQIFGIESQKMFLIKLFNNSRDLSKFDIVKFNHSMRKTNHTYVGTVFDYYVLNQERWAKVLQLSEAQNYQKNLIDNTVYSTNDSEREDFAKKIEIDDFVGVVVEGSNIGRIKFEYSKKKNNIQEGDLLQLSVAERVLFYQVVGGVTSKETLEFKNEAGFIEGEAVQLGEWKSTDLSFKKFGWVPEINTPLFIAQTSEMKIPAITHPEFSLGKIPGTKLPSVLNLDEAISHHTALLGITGSGKSHLAREIVRQLMNDTKVIIVDFTSEWSKELEDLKLENMAIGGGNIDDFLKSQDKKIGVVAVPDMSNTEDILDQTEKLFEKIFNYAKEQYKAGSPAKIALVLEEAHTITPEASFLGVGGDFGKAKAIVSKMSQVALQGRKYGVGMLVIAQRTANVSKTVLTQCNTVICFQAYDETSFNFLGNYVGKDLAVTLPNLKQYHAIVAGKALKSNVPMIIDLTK